MGRGLAAEACRETRNKDQTMMIERTTFGTITIDGKTYEHDVIIRLSGEVVKRKKKLSKKYYGTSHVPLERRSKVCLREGMQTAHPRLGPDGQFCISHRKPRPISRKRAVGCGCSPRLRRSVRSTDRALGRPDFFT